MLTEGKISYLKAAEEAGMNVWDFAELLKEKKVVWVKQSLYLCPLMSPYVPFISRI
jgi:hypothetical protein